MEQYLLTLSGDLFEDLEWSCLELENVLFRSGIASLMAQAGLDDDLIKAAGIMFLIAIFKNTTLK